jgi:hypothetical protein
MVNAGLCVARMESSGILAGRRRKRYYETTADNAAASNSGLHVTTVWTIYQGDNARFHARAFARTAMYLRITDNNVRRDRGD